MTILISGAAGFLGKNYTEYLLKKNYKIIAVDNNLPALKKLKKDNLKFKNNLLIFNINITSENKIKKLYNLLKKKKIIINTLINNAAIDSVPQSSKINKINIDQLKKELDVSLIGCYLLINYFVDDMIKRKYGRIINIGSDLSVIAPNQKIYYGIFKNYIKPVSYSLTKHAVVGLTKYYASLYGGSGVTVNMLSPGPIFNKHNSKFVKRLKSLIPENRMGKPSDLFSAIDFLIDRKNKYFNGQNIIVDGGRTIV
jgi:NAD(P)-dependent dehydrogenase (short-subunit alcohol dehydrogenase family)